MAAANALGHFGYKISKNAPMRAERHQSRAEQSSEMAAAATWHVCNRLG